MQVATGMVVEGKLVLEGVTQPGGTVVTIFAKDSEALIFSCSRGFSKMSSVKTNKPKAPALMDHSRLLDVGPDSLADCSNAACAVVHRVNGLQGA